VSRPPYEQFAAVRRFAIQSNLSFSPDGGHVAYVQDAGGQLNLWRIPVTGGWPTQLTLQRESAVGQHAWTRHGFVFGIDDRGNERWQPHHLPEAGGWPRDLAGRPDVQHFVGQQHPDGESVAILANATRPEDMSVYRLDVRDGELRPLLDDEANYNLPRWHPDGRRLAVAHAIDRGDSDVVVLDTATRERTVLTRHQGDEANFPVGFGAGGLYVFTDRGHDFNWLGRLALDGDCEPEPVWRGEWDVEFAGIDRAGRRLAWVTNEDGISVFHARDVERGRELLVPELPRGRCVLFAIAPDGRRLAAVIATASRPSDLYVADLDEGTSLRLTDSFLGGIPEDDLIRPELVRYPTFDGRRVPAWLYRPRTAGPSPVVVAIHGGPEAQDRGVYAPLAQYVLSRGVGVLAPNIRGSTGYGKEYRRLIQRDWGGGELRDIEASARYLHGLPWVDRSRLAVMGGSFGGFATLSAMSRLPELWACGVDLCGPSNLVTALRSVPPTWRRFNKRWMGDPDEDAELLTARSPITYVDQVRAPLFVWQGARDPRVVQGESDQMVERLRGLGREVEYVVFDDEGHGITKRANELRLMPQIARFLFTHLGVPE
jgi:dipeptidyl aminopeptidase/acylaminoacyl peptidase